MEAIKNAMPLTPRAKAVSATPQDRSTPSTPQTGSWEHPRLGEITRRQNATTFGDRNVRRVIYNGSTLFICWVLEKFLRAKLPVVFKTFEPLQPWPTYLYYFLRFVFAYNIFMAFWPLLRPKDDLSDIPLTPAQRSLLGLPPASAPPTPGSTYITPPRYARSPVPRNSASNSPRGGSPLSGSPRDSPMNGTPSKEGRGSPFSPGASPLLQKSFNNQRRGSYGSPSPLGRIGAEPGTPSPSGGGKASVGLNSKWLYEKGRAPGGAGGRLFTKLD